MISDLKKGINSYLTGFAIWGTQKRRKTYVYFGQCIHTCDQVNLKACICSVTRKGYADGYLKVISTWPLHQPFQGCLLNHNRMVVCTTLQKWFRRGLGTVVHKTIWLNME